VANTKLVAEAGFVVPLKWRFFLDFPISYGAPHSLLGQDLLIVTLRHTALSKTLLDERSARRRNLYMTTHNTHKRHPCPRHYSKPQSQQASGSRPTALTARLPVSIFYDIIVVNIRIIFFWKMTPCSLIYSDYQKEEKFLSCINRNSRFV